MTSGKHSCAAAVRARERARPFALCASLASAVRDSYRPERTVERDGYGGGTGDVTHCAHCATALSRDSAGLCAQLRGCCVSDDLGSAPLRCDSLCAVCHCAALCCVVWRCVALCGVANEWRRAALLS